MKKILIALMVSLVSICMYAKDFYPTCSGNDGISYVQGSTSTTNGITTLELRGYGQYANSSVIIIVYSKRHDGKEVEWYRRSADIRNGEGRHVDNGTMKDASRVEIMVSNTCN